MMNMFKQQEYSLWLSLTIKNEGKCVGVSREFSEVLHTRRT